MGRKKRHKPAVEPQAKPEKPVPDAEPRPVTRSESKKCPLCGNGYGGVGRVYSSKSISGTLYRQYLKCDQCGNTWTADVRIETVRVTHRETYLRER